MNFRFAPALAVSLLLTGGIASAVPITGVLNFTGGVRVTTTAIDFLPPAGDDGSIFVTPGAQEGSFEPIDGTFGSILDLDRTLFPVGPVFLENFITLDGDISFTLTEILAGTFSPAQCGAAPGAGQTCTPPPLPGLGVSPFNLSNQSPSSSVASFEVRGYFVDDLTGDQMAASGIFTTQFNAPFQTILTQLQNQGFVQANSYSATFTAVPEPSALALGMIGIGLIAVRRLWTAKN